MTLSSDDRQIKYFQFVEGSWMWKEGGGEVYSGEELFVCGNNYSVWLSATYPLPRCFFLKFPYWYHLFQGLKWQILVYGAGAEVEAVWIRPFFAWSRNTPFGRSRSQIWDVGRSQSRPKKWRLRNTVFIAHLFKRRPLFTSVSKTLVKRSFLEGK